MKDFGKYKDFIGLVVCTDDYYCMNNIKWFKIIDPIVKSDKGGASEIILVAGSTGMDERQDFDNCSIGDTLLMHAFYRNSPHQYKIFAVTIIEDQPLYSLPYYTYGYFEYKKGICYLSYPNEELGKYSEIREKIVKRINKTE